MKKEKAIEIIEFKLGRGKEAERFGLRNCGVSSWIGKVPEEREALEMAISALKEPTWQEKLEKEYLFESIKEDMTKLQAENERLLKEVEALKGEWIPVSERLPKPYEQVLRTVKSIGWNGTSYIDVDLGTICPIDTDVIAWQPLPEPYKKGE